MKIHNKVFTQLLIVNSNIDETLKRTKQKCRVLSYLVYDLLDLAKYESSKFEINEDYFNLIEVITEAFNI